jgi:phenylpyruvate tautomerase PptA (4-oxalocrotonate tautomerase family)
MTVITVKTPSGRFDGAQRRKLAETLTDAVLVPEVGQFTPAARAGFQVHFTEFAPDMMAIGGVLLSDQKSDPMLIDIAVMEGHWPQAARADVINRIFIALTEASGLPKPSAAWWVNFRVIEEGSWGSRGRVLSILDLLASGAFTDEKADAIKETLISRNASPD